jgi:hypothetical protein
MASTTTIGKQSLFKPITFEDEALWYEEGYAMLKAQNSSPVFGRHAFNYAIQHDNARCHVVRVCTEFLNQQHICMFSWPALPQNYYNLNTLRPKSL